MATLHVDAVLKGIHMTFSVTYVIIHILSRMLALYVASLMQTLRHAVQGKTCKPWKKPSLFKGLAAGPSYLIWQVGTENLPVKKIYWLNLSAAAVSVLFCSCCFFSFQVSIHSSLSACKCFVMRLDYLLSSQQTISIKPLTAVISEQPVPTPQTRDWVTTQHPVHHVVSYLSAGSESSLVKKWSSSYYSFQSLRLLSNSGKMVKQDH